MGNKQKTWRERHRKDPRTKTTMRKRNRDGLVTTSETGITSTTSDNLDDSALPGPSNYCPGKPVEKGVCVGHVQKRVGGRLRKLKKEKGGEGLSDGKILGGIGRLNEKFINRLQNYYGLAIRQNTDSLINTRKAVGPVLKKKKRKKVPL